MLYFKINSHSIDNNTENYSHEILDYTIIVSSLSSSKIVLSYYPILKQLSRIIFHFLIKATNLVQCLLNNAIFDMAPLQLSIISYTNNPTKNEENTLVEAIKAPEVLNIFHNLYLSKD